MAQKKAHEVEAWIKRPDPQYGIVLLYGPDRGLVAERAKALISSAGLPVDDPFSVVRLDASEADAAPGRLLDEARMVPMFGDRRLIWLRDANTHKNVAADIRELAQEPAVDAILIIEGGDLKKGNPLRSAVEAGRSTMALPCYPDEGRSIDALIDEGLGQAGLRITLEARQALKTMLGGDRLATRGEIEKLTLYCRGQDEVGLDDITAAIGDVSSLSVDMIVDAVLNGRAQSFDQTLSQLLATGTAPFLVLSATMRQLHALQLMRAQMERSGTSASQVVASARPPVFFARRKLIEATLQRWPLALIAAGLDRLQAAVLLSRRRPELAAAIVRQSLIAILAEGARASRSRH